MAWPLRQTGERNESIANGILINVSSCQKQPRRDGKSRPVKERVRNVKRLTGFLFSLSGEHAEMNIQYVDFGHGQTRLVKVSSDCR
jgi:hypothetical protein